MKRFEFTLQPVLSHKKRLEEGLQLELARVEEQAAGERQRLKELGEQEDEQLRRLRQQHASARLDVDSIVATLGFLSGLAGAIRTQQVVVQRAALAVEEKRAELLHMAQAARALEKLKHRRVAEYEDESKREEARETDEIATGQFNFRRSTGTSGLRGG